MAGLAAAGTVTLAPASERAADCAAIEVDTERLTCYDNAHRRALPRVARPTPAPASDQDDTRRDAGALGSAWSTAGMQPFGLRPYRAIYVLPLSATDTVNRRPVSPAPGHDVGVDLPNRAEEVKFQFSAKTLLSPRLLGGRGDLWLAYTQSSRWQLYQGDISRPFRETNYEPELVFNVMTDGALLGWTARTAGLSLNHQSNGRALPLSRSWNRVIGHLGLERGNWSMLVRAWVRLGEPPARDDNPDVLDHIGRADLTIRHEPAGGGTMSLRLRHTLRGGDTSRGAAEFEWAFPLAGRLHGYLQVFSGYGESLIDYNIRQSRVGLGFSLAGWH